MNSKLLKSIAIGLVLACVATAANATCPTFHTLMNGTPASANDVMDNYDYILQCPNFTGNVGIGNATPSAALTIGSQATNPAAGAMILTNSGANQNGLAIYDSWADSGTADELYFWRNGGGVGSISTTLTATTYNTGSDRRIKEGIVPTHMGLSTLLQIPVQDFKFIKDTSHTIKQGFIAQDLYKYYPEAVVTNGDNGQVPLGANAQPWMVDYGRLTPLIVSSVQELNAKVESQRAEIAALEASHAQQVAAIKELRGEIESLRTKSKMVRAIAPPGTAAESGPNHS